MFSCRIFSRASFNYIIGLKPLNNQIAFRLCSTVPKVDISDPAVLQYLENSKKEYWELKTKIDINRAEYNRLRDLIPIVKVLEDRACIVDNLKNLSELNDEKDKDMAELMKEERDTYNRLLRGIDDKLVEVLFPSEVKYAASESILEVSAGVGGQEAMLFAKELFNMYCRFAAYKKWDFDVTQLEETEIGGVRKAVLEVAGPGSWEVLRWEAGVHRVQRIPATEKGGRLHTSTCSVAVLMQPNEIEVVIPDNDIKIETKRSSGAGGQHVNTTDSAVRIVHLPTGLAVECQTERDQHKNRKSAMARLRALLYQQQQDKQLLEERTERKSQVGTGLRNEKIRTYNYNQDRVTDHRLGASNGTVHNLKGLMEGGEILESLIHHLRRTFHARNVLEDIESIRKRKPEI